MKRALIIPVVWAIIAAGGVSVQNNYLVSVATATAFLAVGDKAGMCSARATSRLAIRCSSPSLPM